jgi:hypothetical protein
MSPELLKKRNRAVVLAKRHGIALLFYLLSNLNCKIRVSNIVKYDDLQRHYHRWLICRLDGG